MSQGSQTWCRGTRTFVCLLMAGLLSLVTWAGAAITVRETDWSFDTDSGTAQNTISGFTVGPRRGGKLVLCASWENSNTGISATWNGSETFTVAVNSAAGRNSAILYLDDPTPGTGDIVVTLGANGRSRVGVLHVTGTKGGVAATAFDATAPAESGSLTTTAAGSLVVGVYTINNDGGISGSPFASDVFPIGDAGSAFGSAGYQIEATAGVKNYAWTTSGSTSESHALAAFVADKEPRISVVNTGSKLVPGLGPNSTTLSFNAGATASKLIVAVSAETAGTDPPAITYHGVPLTQATGTAYGSCKGIFYLDKPYKGGAADLIVDMSSYSVVNGVGFGVVSIAGAAPGVSATARGVGTNSVTITPKVEGSFVVVGYGANDGASAAVNAPLTQIYGGDIGSAQGAAGYMTDVAALPQTYSFTGGSPGFATGAAAFRPLLPGTVILIR